MIKRLLSTSLMGILIVCSMYATPVSLQRATEVADSFLQNASPAGPHRAPARARLVSSSVKQAPYYVFENTAGGFVIVAGDDIAYPILGYSSNTQWASNNIPDNVQAWLDNYSRQIQWAQDNDIQPDSTITNAWKRISSRKKATIVVSPLLLTTWNQSPYYNDMCPMDTKQNARTVVGCVATAMAQVLKYWEYPVVGNGSHSYSHAFGEQTANFGNTTYDWANMPLELTATSTDVQKAAVAQLMYHCGVSVEMDYGVSSSGAFTISSKSNSTHCAEYAFREYWGYKPTLQGLQKSKYTDKEWKQMLKDDLKAGRPVIYSGYGEGGHCFICDGYDEDEYFHFNWGWGGLYDGYFKLNALAPGTGGIGSGGGSYNNDQQAIFGLEPLKSLDNDETTKELQLASTISISSSEIAYKEGFSISASVKNTGSANFNGDLGLALYDSGLELLTVMDAKSTTIAAGGVVDCIFGTNGWSELVTGVYSAASYFKSASEDWSSIGKGAYRNMVQFRIGEKGNACIDPLIYECDFEGDLLGWTFAKADGINTGFAVGNAMKYKGEKGLYISPDGGATAGYTQDNDNGYVSIAYKKIYLDPGQYKINWYYSTNLSYLDVDKDNYRIAVIPATSDLTPLDYYVENPPFLSSSLMNHSYNNNENWRYDWWNFTIPSSGYYFLVYTFSATEQIVHENGLGIDNITITEITPPFLVTMQETIYGVKFQWGGSFPEYKILWYTDCNKNYKRDTIATKSYLIPYSQLRDLTYGTNSLRFEVSGVCENGTTTSVNNWYSVYTSAFPLDTCPAVPDFKIVNTDVGVKLTWKGNSGVCDVKFGTNYYGCDWIGSLNGVSDTALIIPYTTTSGLSEGSFNFFVRGICPNDTSIWRRAALTIIAPDANTSDLCLAKPANFYAQNTNAGIMLTWKGNADKYEVECRSEDEYYKRGNIYENNDSNFVRFIANANTYTIPYNTLTDTLYHFRVRAICEQDTSFWTDYISAYNINFGDYCIPFYDLCGPNTLCTYGNYSNPYSNKKTLDYRQKDWKESYYTSYNYEMGRRYGLYGVYGWNDTYYRSRHTICFEGETDPRCDNELTTVPKGEKYSMRLGNWYNGEGESVTFTHKIDSGYPLVLLLKYAVVLQDPSHTSAENPHFTLEILDENNVALDPICWYADFAADKNAEGWKNAVNAHEPTSEEYRNVVWKDWTTIGVNLTDLSKDGDKIIKIRLTTKDCTRGQHYGYAYFTLSCTSGDMQGMSCGERPEKFEVAEGFKYHWYLMDDPTKALVCDSNVFIVQPTDTNSYYVDMISLENDECYYTLKAYTLPRLPRSQATFTHTPHECTNEVTIRNSSYVYKIMLDGTEQRDGRIQIDSILWDLGPYGTSTDWEPQLVVPNEGDTFKITLHTLANACHASQEYTLEIPSIVAEDGYTYKYMCEGEIVHHQGQTFTQTGTYILDTTLNSLGCDSISYLVLDYMQKDTIHLYDTVCFGMLPYDFYGQNCTQAGSYQHIIYTKSGCDSVYYLLDLHIYQRLDAQINPVSEICSGEPSFDLSYNTLSDASLEFSVIFSELAKAAGFADTTGYTDTQGMFTIHLPENVLPNTYTAEVTIDNHGCEMVTLPITIPVLYSSQIIIQRWNDLLAVSKSIADSYQGFYQYQWYFNGTPIEGETGTYYYNPNGLQMDGFYQVELTRHQDSTVIISCPYMPELHPDTQTLIVQPTALTPSESMQITAPDAGEMHIICNTGYSMGKSHMQAGDNTVAAPAISGLYFIHLTTQDGQQYVQKIIVY